jgi:hypothetical protein
MVAEEVIKEKFAIGGGKENDSRFQITLGNLADILRIVPNNLLIPIIDPQSRRSVSNYYNFVIF